MRAGTEVLTKANRFFKKWFQYIQLLKTGCKLPKHLKPSKIKRVLYSSFSNQIYYAISNSVLIFRVIYCSVNSLP